MKHVAPSFTLVELLITTAIAMVVIGGTVAGFVRFNERQLVLNTVRELQSTFRAAQSKARVRAVPSNNEAGTSITCNELVLYHVRLINGGKQYRLGAVCKTAGVETGHGLKTVKIDNSLIITHPTDSTDLWTQFYTLEAGTNITDKIVVVVQRTDGSYPFSFTVSKNGAISNIYEGSTGDGRLVE